MEETPRDPQFQALHRAARGFTRALAAQALLAQTARIEAVVRCAEAEPVFLFERALRRAWPARCGRPPLGEVMWALDHADGATRLEVGAFDGAGRLLLRRAYETGAGGWGSSCRLGSRRPPQ